MWSEFVLEHQRNRTAALEQELLRKHLPGFRRLERISLTNISANDIPVASVPISSPTVRKWHEWLRQGCRLLVAPSVCWNIRTPLTYVQLQENLRIHDQDSLLLAPAGSFRGLVILLRALTKVKHSVTEFVIKPLYSGPRKYEVDSGISDNFFRHWHDDLDRMETLVSSLHKLQLVISWGGSMPANTLHLTRVLSGAKLLRHLHLEARHHGCLVRALGRDTIYPHLEHVTFGGYSDPARLKRFSVGHPILHTLRLDKCVFFDDDKSGEEVEEEDKDELFLSETLYRNSRLYLQSYKFYMNPKTHPPLISDSPQIDAFWAKHRYRKHPPSLTERVEEAQRSSS